jgi:hypothetical protein
MSKKKKGDYKTDRGKRNKMIGVWCTQEEHDWILKEANKAGPSKGAYMRKVVLGELPQANVPYRKEDRRLQFKNGITHEDMNKVLRQDLSNVQNNLNQVARKLNSGRPVDEKVEAMLEGVQSELDKISRVIVMALR